MTSITERRTAALADRYTLERELGRGGMATVYLARDVRHARQVAIKVLHPLRGRLERETQLPIDDAVRIAREVGDALHRAHERGVVHRDIKPENILLQRGHALVADFGIALVASGTGTLTQRRSIALTPDGSRLAFVFAAPDGTREIWIRRLDEPEATPLSGTKGAEVPFWSPDGRSIGFFSEGFLMVRDANGTVRQLCAGVEPTSAAWGAKDDIVYAHRLGISVVRGDGSNCRRVIRRDSGTLLKAAMLPDGERFVYSRRDTDSLTVAGIDGKTIMRLPLFARDVQLAPPKWLALTNEVDSRALGIQEMDWESLTPRGPRTMLLTGLRAAGGEFTLAIADDALVFLPGTLDRPYLEYNGNGKLRDSVRINGTWTLDAFQESGGAIKVALGGNLGGLWMYDLESDRSTRLVVRASGATSKLGIGILRASRLRRSRRAL